MTPLLTPPRIAAMSTEQEFVGAIDDADLLSVDLTGDWPEDGCMRVYFTLKQDCPPNAEFCPTLDYYASAIGIQNQANLLACAEAIASSLGTAFVQGGMANETELQPQADLFGNVATVSAGLYSTTGQLERPSSQSVLRVLVKPDCEFGDPDDAIDDNHNLIADSAIDYDETDPNADPDADGRTNLVEFAFNSHTEIADGSALAVSLDDGRPTIRYDRHPAAARTLQFELEASQDGDLWEHLPSAEVTIESLGQQSVRVHTRSNIPTGVLGDMLLRVRLSPRL